MHVDDGLVDSKVLVDAAEEGEDKRAIRDLLINIAESIGQRLDAGAVLRDGHGALAQVEELGFQLNGPPFLVVLKQILNACPDGLSSGTVQSF